MLILYSSPQIVPGPRKDSNYLQDKYNFLYFKKYSRPCNDGAYISTFWKCIHKGLPSCPATITTKKASQADNTEYYYKETDPEKHNHVPDLSKLIKWAAIKEVRTMAIAETSTTPRQVFSNLTAKLAQQGEIVNIKQYTLARRIQGDRQAQAGRPKTPNTYQDVLDLLLDDLKKCIDGSEFLVYGGSVN